MGGYLSKSNESDLYHEIRCQKCGYLIGKCYGANAGAFSHNLSCNFCSNQFNMGFLNNIGILLDYNWKVKDMDIYYEFELAQTGKLLIRRLNKYDQILFDKIFNVSICEEGVQLKDVNSNIDIPYQFLINLIDVDNIKLYDNINKCTDLLEIIDEDMEVEDTEIDVSAEEYYYDSEEVKIKEEEMKDIENDDYGLEDEQSNDADDEESKSVHEETFEEYYNVEDDDKYWKDRSIIDDSQEYDEPPKLISNGKRELEEGELDDEEISELVQTKIKLSPNKRWKPDEMYNPENPTSEEDDYIPNII